MRVSAILTAIASWLESPDNEAILLAEYDEACLQATAQSCIAAAEILKKGAEEIEKIEPAEESALTPEKLDRLHQIISALDQSDDEELQKTASVLDELLLTLATPPNWVNNYKEAQENRLDVLKQKYEDTKKQLDEANKVKESAQAIDKSPMFREVRIMQHSLSARSCPDHPGAQMARVGEHMWQCSMDKKVYNYQTGYTTEKGEKVPGGDVALQFETHPDYHQIFDNRESRLLGYNRDK
jgi:hypothetical protein